MRNAASKEWHKVLDPDGKALLNESSYAIDLWNEMWRAASLIDQLARAMTVVMLIWKERRGASVFASVNRIGGNDFEHDQRSCRKRRRCERSTSR